MRYMFDMDNTLCTTNGTDYENADPIEPRITHVKELIEQGHDVAVYTARGDMHIASIPTMLNLTRSQLESWGLGDIPVYHKPWADVYVDDRAYDDKSYFNTNGVL